MDCINLRERFGDRYKVDYEESYRADRGDRGRTEDPWLMIHLCERGHICPWGGDLRAVCTDAPGPTAKKVMALPFVDHNESMVGSDGVNAVFPIEHFEEVARLMKPRKRRRMSEEQRRASAERLADYAFRPARQASGASAVCEEGDRGEYLDVGATASV